MHSPGSMCERCHIMPRPAKLKQLERFWLRMLGHTKCSAIMRMKMRHICYDNVQISLSNVDQFMCCEKHT